MCCGVGLECSVDDIGEAAFEDTDRFALANRLVGILHGCLHHQTPYNEHTAWAHRFATAA